MEHDLIDTIVISLVLAFILGFIAKKLKFPAILGYLLAGVMVGPFTPGFVADVSLANQLAEIGIILLMFGVGLHFSFQDLLRVRNIALPGAFFQMSVATLIGCMAGMAFGMELQGAFVFGLSLSCASTVVLLRALEERHIVHTETGKIAVGWLIVEDIAMVLALVLLPVLANMNASSAGGAGFGLIIKEFVIVLCKIGVFGILMIVVGTRVLPWLLVSISKTKSSELMTLGTLAIATGFAFVAYTVFDASFALGAFLAGLVLSESEIGQKSAEKSLPMRDAFAVLFFVSVGMLFDPSVLWQHPFMVLFTLAIIVVGKSLAALAITALFRQKTETSLTVAISLAQIGEFSFILASMGVTYGMMNQDAYNFILAGALLSISLNPFLFKMFDYYKARYKPDPVSVLASEQV